MKNTFAKFMGIQLNTHEFVCAHPPHGQNGKIEIQILWIFLPSTWVRLLFNIVFIRGGGVLALGLDAPIMENTFQNVKKIRQKDSQCTSEQFISPIKFCSENTFFVICVKKKKKMVT
jgi:hypothetical protein